MEWIVRTLIAMGAIGLVLILVFGVPAFIWFYLAPTNRFFTFVKEGTAKIVVLGDGVVEVLMQWRGYTLDDKWNVVPVGKWVKDGLEVSEETPGAQQWGPRPGFHIGGLWHYGFWPVKDIFGYWFRWTGLTEDGEIDPHSKEWMDYILVIDDVYLCEVKEAEDKNLLPLTIRILLTIRIVNPYKALFRVQNWLETIINRVRPLVRDYVTDSTYEELITVPERMGTDILKAIRKEVSLGGDFWGRYGVDLRKTDVSQIEPPSEYRAITLRRYTAERELERIVVEASAEAQRIAIVYTEIERRGDLGKLVRSLEALEKSPEAGAKWVIPLPGLTDQLFRAVFAKPLEEATGGQIQRLHEIVEKLGTRLSSQEDK